MRIYVSGQMTGMPDHNFPEFNRVSAELRALGHEVSNPAEKGNIDGWHYKDYMAVDFIEICKLREPYGSGIVGCLVLLPGWEKSPGANKEVELAEYLEIPQYTYADFMVREHLQLAHV